MAAERMQMVPMDAIIVTSNVRTDVEAKPTGLADSITEVGLLHPIRLRRCGDKFTILTGERRFRAMQFLGKTEIEAIIEEKQLCDAEILTRQLIENCQRRGLPPVVTASAIRELMKLTDSNASQVAKLLGFSSATVSRLLALLELPPDIQTKVESGEIAPATGYHIKRASDPEKQARMAEQAANGRLTRDEAGAEVKKPVVASSGHKKASSVRARAELAEGRTVTVSGPELTLDVFVSCLEKVLAQARKAKRQGLELVVFLKQLKPQE